MFIARNSQSVWVLKSIHLKVRRLVTVCVYSRSEDLFRWQGKKLVTVTLVNEIFVDRKEANEKSESGSLFQVQIEISAGHKTILVPRPSNRERLREGDDDDLSTELLYRDVEEYATGHTCSAEWIDDDTTGQIARVITTWIPQAIVYSVNPNGCSYFNELLNNSNLLPLSAEWLSNAPTPELSQALLKLPDSYDKWISSQEKLIDTIKLEYKNQALRNLNGCRDISNKIREGINQITNNPLVAEAFRLANSAMSIQNSWNPDRKGTKLQWRPFQLGFILLTLSSLSDRNHKSRNDMDLLWFPTGGGKTEAYLTLIAFIAFYRRIINVRDPDNGAGVVSVMRYTLRLLTTQQFSRAASMILACESIRRGKNKVFSAHPLGDIPFSIGLWVGGQATPNSYKEAKKGLEGDSTFPSPEQLTFCPACKNKLQWRADDRAKAIHVRCNNRDCILYDENNPLPVHTVDTDLYREKPTLVIGTIDKFAQITRNSNIDQLFSISIGNPPDLIIQDELHLISGPLGTIAGIYEIAIDYLFKRGDTYPKIIGSTATIRKARDQVRALFNRGICQFPPPGINWDDSGFAVTDSKKPGRKYAGVTTAGRSAKFTLQAVSASLLQSTFASIKDVEERDPYWTLVTYFNSLRELGGALVLMQDDVNDTISLISRSRNETERIPENIEELTSRRTQDDILTLLDQLTVKSDKEDALDIILATNMLSVGVDIPRLGLMVVNGQPKGISEYIQATSRVGREKPGLIISVLNNAKARDRSHYETFRTWHQTLYRDVEATSVTPFAPRARDRALHAALVALFRFKVAGMHDKPDIKHADNQKIDEIIRYIIDRAESIDPEEKSVFEDINEKLDSWRRRSPPEYWGEPYNQSLLIDADLDATLKSQGGFSTSAWPTMNNMRSVEPSCSFRLRHTLTNNQK